VTFSTSIPHGPPADNGRRRWNPRRCVRILGAGVAMAVVVVLGSAAVGAAFAAQDTPSQVTRPLSSSSSKAGAVTLKGGGCPANSTVNIDAQGQSIASATTDSAGSFSTAVTLPSGTGEGAAVVGVTCGQMIVNVTVPQSDSRPLGAEAAPLIGVGAAIVIFLGTLALVLRRRVRTPEFDHPVYGLAASEYESISSPHMPVLTSNGAPQ
jgi:hypothetical protein